MPPVVMAAAVLGTATLGASAMSASSAEDTNEAQIAQQNVANEQNVYNYQHRHQWETEDLNAAGLNPILSANSGASIPAMQAAQLSNPLQNLPGQISSTAAQITDSMVNKAVIDTNKSQQNLNNANAAKSIVEATKTGQDVNMHTWKSGNFGKTTGFIRSLVDTLNPIPGLLGRDYGTTK